MIDQKEYRKKWLRENHEKVRQYGKRYRNDNPDVVMFAGARQRAKTRGLEFNLERTDIVIPTHCPVFGFEIVSGQGVGMGHATYHAPSLDRIDNSKGYIKGNVQVISHLANTMKSTASPEQLKLFAEWIMKTYE